MIVLVGGAGQPGDNLVTALNAANFNDLVIVFDHKNDKGASSLNGKRFTKKIRYKELTRFLDVNQLHVQFVIVTSTDGFQQAEPIWNTCIQWGLPLIVASTEKTAFDDLADKSELKPYYWSIIKYNEKDITELPRAILERMHDRKQPGVYELAGV
ncbi:Rossmann-fold NAD(P)-binding domain-containing protein [Solitalea canadensis]|uniref:Uncharacterized protein n=1 Tax=Solitalea canadensis (strain ATCC 29591 / DSM 3403 / JCM 21819 / LMG 8368 / NBRC 15130 / NCIMB 12057 / USAM 9D) TaxID=929556 RepID=H8KL66_SOLCM|nr:hypothetical protein [Solitalea canadensis]AFD09149.1 hypothetical protein Solca_4159 [Solitalea canadensis DSM 3403]